jgi:hypothetical protein
MGTRKRHAAWIFAGHLCWALGTLAAAGCGGGDSGSAASAASTAASVQSAPPPSQPPPPTIAGTPSTQVQVGQPYAFAPTAADAGATLSFSIQNKPAWGSFSIATGQLTGTPSAGDVGTYADIVIAVSNGTASASLASFEIAVSAAPAPPPVTGTATLSWLAPTTNTNGTPLTDLAGYVINYGTSAAAMTQSVNITDPSTNTYTLQGLVSGTWYFTVTAYATDGTQSIPSSVGSKTIS